MATNYTISSSYPDSHDSSPRSREIDSENPSWDELPPNYKVKFMCSYGGKIHPRPHDNQLAYVGGETKIIAVDRAIRFSDFVSKLSSLCGSDVSFKYQLPGEDLDALISVTNDEDLEHMMLEYDRLYRASAKPARLRLFLFQPNPPAQWPAAFGTSDTKSERQWFVDALNSVQIQPLETSSPPAAATDTGNPDFLFGFDKGVPPEPSAKLHEQAPPPPTVPDALSRVVYAGSDPRSDDRYVTGDPVVSHLEIERQIQELHRLQIANQGQTMLRRKSEENNLRAYPGDYYPQKHPETLPPSAPQSAPVSVPASAYWHERNAPPACYAMAGHTGTDQPVYLIQTPGGYQTASIRPVSSQAGPVYYGMPQMGHQVYYGAVPPQGTPAVQAQSKAGTYTDAAGTVLSTATGAATVVDAAGYAQVPYDGAGRQVHYTAAGAQYAAVSAAAADGRPIGVMSQDGKVVAKASGVPPTV